MARNDGRTTARGRRAADPAAEAPGRTMQAEEDQQAMGAGAFPATGRAQPMGGRGTPTYGAADAAETAGATATQRAYTAPEFWVGTRRYGPY